MTIEENELRVTPHTALMSPPGGIVFTLYCWLIRLSWFVRSLVQFFVISQVHFHEI